MPTMKDAPRCSPFLAKHTLIVGHYYVGKCRNANVARWDGERFWHWRLKFGTIFTESIQHREDEPYFDVFDPMAHVQEHEVAEIPMQETTLSKWQALSDATQ